MALVRYTEQFWRDFDQILDRLDRAGGEDLARRYAGRIHASLDQLITHPGIGAPRAKFGQGVRMLVVEPYLIFYEGGPKAKEVTVLRLVDGRRRITRRTIAAGKGKAD